MNTTVVVIESCLWCGNDFEKPKSSGEQFCSTDCQYYSEYEDLES